MFITPSNKHCWGICLSVMFLCSNDKNAFFWGTMNNDHRKRQQQQQKKCQETLTWKLRYHGYMHIGLVAPK